MAYNKVTLSTGHRFEELESYRNFLKEKKIIQAKYPSKPWNVHAGNGRPGNHKDPFDTDWWNDWQSYKKEITDLILTPNGNFQQFTWELISEKNEEIMERKARGVKRSIYY